MYNKFSIFKQAALPRAVFVLTVFILAAQALPAQTLDTGILGKVTDAPGSVIPGATVTITQPATGFTHSVLPGAPLPITHPATGFTRSVTTTGDGAYEVRYLQPGEYTLEVRMQG